MNYAANSTDRDEFLVDVSTYVQKKWGGVVGALATSPGSRIGWPALAPASCSTAC